MFLLTTPDVDANEDYALESMECIWDYIKSLLSAIHLLTEELNVQHQCKPEATEAFTRLLSSIPFHL
jgi:hypothetical protein